MKKWVWIIPLWVGLFLFGTSIALIVVDWASKIERLGDVGTLAIGAANIAVSVYKLAVKDEQPDKSKGYSNLGLP